MESDVRGRMQPLREQLTETMNHLHTVFETHVFVALCRGYWDRMGQVDHAQNIDADCCSFLMIEKIRFVFIDDAGCSEFPGEQEGEQVVV